MERSGAPNGPEQEEIFRKKRLSEGGIAFSVGAVSVVLLSFLFLSIAGGAEAQGQTWYLYLSYLLPQLAFLGAAALYFARSKEKPLAVCPPCKPRYFALALTLQFGLVFSLSELNGLFIGLLEKFGYEPAGVPLPPLNGWNLLPAILVIALLPAVFEELFFRGILSRAAYGGGWGLWRAVLLSGALFALYHGNPEQTLYQFCCGACFSLIALRAGSILPTVLAHFANNALILVLSACGVGELSALPQAAYVSLVVLSAICLAGTLACLVFFDRRGEGRGEMRGAGAFFAAAAVGIAVCAVEWIVALIAGFAGA